ncbi:MAG: hypothetical protein HWQ41_07240 [Nostoc sp. NOS(2021)]|uniref:hypothetical protein n=1 Tax=Nostoc sp. NOS(2021) TaxID=2815407 RepID=UPI0025FBCDB3|nr:hypothetical protein [Nostoc sp. NOS(2021)]MBN3895054.1 hypothetical protein [Nostoc sp. NOS(2021)]
MPHSKSEVWKIGSVNAIFIAIKRLLTAKMHFAVRAIATPTPYGASAMGSLLKSRGTVNAISTWTRENTSSRPLFLEVVRRQLHNFLVSILNWASSNYPS